MPKFKVYFSESKRGYAIVDAKTDDEAEEIFESTIDIDTDSCVTIQRNDFEIYDIERVK